MNSEQHWKNIELLARELAYHRFCGTIAAHNAKLSDNPHSFRLNGDGDCEKAYVLAEKNKLLFRSEALEIYLKIADIEDDAEFRKEIIKRISPNDTEIVNPILSLDV